MVALPQLSAVQNVVALRQLSAVQNVVGLRQLSAVQNVVDLYQLSSKSSHLSVWQKRVAGRGWPSSYMLRVSSLLFSYICTVTGWGIHGVLALLPSETSHQYVIEVTSALVWH